MSSVTRVLFVVDKQNLDGTWDGVASIWSPVATPQVLDAVADAFRMTDPGGVYRIVQKTRTENLDIVVVA